MQPKYFLPIFSRFLPFSIGLLMLRVLCFSGLYRSQQRGGKDNCRGRNRSRVSRKKIKEIGVQSRAAERRSCQGREKRSWEGDDSYSCVSCESQCLSIPIIQCCDRWVSQYVHHLMIIKKHSWKSNHTLLYNCNRQISRHTRGISEFTMYSCNYDFVKKYVFV